MAVRPDITGLSADGLIVQLASVNNGNITA